MTSLLMLGRISEFDTEIETFTALAEKLKQPQAVWYSSLLQATRAQMQGDYRKATAWSQRFLRQGNVVLDRNATHSYALHTFMANLDTGGIEDIGGAMRAMVESFPRVVGWRAGLALFLTEIGNRREAKEQLDRLFEDNVLEGPQRNDWFAITGGLTLSAENIAEKYRLESLYSSLLPHSDHYVVIGYCSLFWGSVHHLLGILAARLGKWARAESHFQSAFAMNRRVGARACIARAEYDYARILVTRGGRNLEAVEMLESCSVLAEELGMKRLCEKIRSARDARSREREG
jgi:tetratricopeptide (TPR) repeat protein